MRRNGPPGPGRGVEDEGSRAGRAGFSSEITQEQALLTYGVLHYGDHTVVAGVREFRGDEAFEAMASDATAAFERADFPEAVRLMDRHFESSNFSLKNLFRDEQRKLLRLILESTLEETAAVYRQIYENHAPLMRFIGDLRVPLPRVLRTTAEFVLNGSLRRHPIVGGRPHSTSPRRRGAGDPETVNPLGETSSQNSVGSSTGFPDRTASRARVYASSY